MDLYRGIPQVLPLKRLLETHHRVFIVVSMNERLLHCTSASRHLNRWPCASPLLGAAVFHKHSETVTQSTVPFGARWGPIKDATEVE